jgi:uncharacterized membrane protein
VRFNRVPTLIKITGIVCCFCLWLVGILTISSSVPVLAARPPVEPGEERINLDVTYPTLEATPGESSEFSVAVSYITYLGEGENHVFELVATAPKDWSAYLVDPQKKAVKISAVTINPTSLAVLDIRVVVTPPSWYMPEPGEYIVTVEVKGTTQAGEKLENSTELKVIIPATYTLALTPITERYNTSAIAGRDNPFLLKIQNNSSAAIDDIAFSSDKPEEWTVEFSPDGVDSLAADSYQEIEVTIRPPVRAIAGDYVITLNAEGEQTSAEGLDIRVTVGASTIWGWIGVGIILLVIAGVVAIFMRFSRR